YGGSADIATVERDGAVHIQIRDHGPGVPPEELGRLFDAHRRLDHGRSRNEGGLGLGLGIARGIVEANGGTLTLENHTEGGLVATIVLPGATNS
ncbi:MAG TPA: ATP-binding protein, partial [Duganella sp.]|uniref:ATP-binding protein n=1 Tax=Duganella sp. TaxID=1904440 RepID=UPI002ED0A0CB